MIKTLSDHEFDSDSRGARAATADGAVVITVDGEPAQVVVTYGEYRRLKGQSRNILDVLAMPYGAEIDFEIPRLNWVVKDIDLS